MKTDSTGFAHWYSAPTTFVYPLCKYRESCCSPATIPSIDYYCPYYRQYNNENPSSPEDELCLHNSNYIEINAYCDDEAGYPTYSNFTKYMLQSKATLSPDEKRAFWDRVAFTNLLQCFVPQKIEPTYSKYRSLFDRAIPCLAQTLQKLEPQIIYVWWHCKHPLFRTILNWTCKIT